VSGVCTTYVENTGSQGSANRFFTILFRHLVLVVSSTLWPENAACLAGRVLAIGEAA
jgi:hypothetical protein